MATDYNRQIADAVIHRFIDGDGASLTRACRETGIEPATFRDWLKADHDGLANRFRHARWFKAQMLWDEVLELADDASQDWLVLPDGRRVFNEAHFARVERRLERLTALADRLWPGSFLDGPR